MLFKKLIIRFFIASDMVWRPKYSWQLYVHMLRSNAVGMSTDAWLCRVRLMLWLDLVCWLGRFASRDVAHSLGGPMVPVVSLCAYFVWFLPFSLRLYYYYLLLSSSASLLSSVLLLLCTACTSLTVVNKRCIIKQFLKNCQESMKDSGFFSAPRPPSILPFAYRSSL